MKSSSFVLIDPEILSGEPCFAGTRVPVRALLDYIEGGDTLNNWRELRFTNHGRRHLREPTVRLQETVEGMSARFNDGETAFEVLALARVQRSI